MVWRVLIVIYLWAFASLGLAVWCYVLSRREMCPRWVRWVGGLAAAAGFMLLMLAVFAGEPVSLGYFVPIATVVLGAWAAYRGHQRRCPRYWLP